MFEQARMIKELEAKLKFLQREAKEEEQTGIFDVKAERVKTESNEARVMELEVQIFEAERSRAIPSLRENALKAELTEVEERERSYDNEGEYHVRFMG